MMMKRVATSPIHQPDVWIAQAPAIEVEFRTRALEHVGDARHRDEHLEWVGRRWEAWTGPDEWMRAPESIFAGVANAETAAGEANLANDRCQRNHCPERLFAVIGALQRPYRIHHRALAADLACHVEGQRPEPCRIDVRNLAGPICVLDDPVVLAKKISLPASVACAITIEEGAIVTLRSDDFAGEARALLRCRYLAG